MARLALEGGEVPEGAGVVGGEGVSQDVRDPVGETGGAAEGLPAAFPVARDAEGEQVGARAQGDGAAAAGFAGLRADEDAAPLRVDD